MRILLSTLLLCLFINLNGQVALIKVKCRVVDALSSTPVSLATVTNMNGYNKTSAITDYSGTCWLDLPQGKQNLQIEHLGYAPLSIEVIVNDKVTGEFNFTLYELSYNMDDIIVYGNQNKTKNIIRNVVANFSAKLVSTIYQSSGFVRKTRTKDNLYVFYGDAEIDHINGGYASVGHAYNISKAKNIRISDQDISLSTFNSESFTNFGGSLLSYDQILLPLLLNDSFDFFVIDNPTEKLGRNCIEINYRRIPEKWRVQKGRFLMYDERYQYGKIVIDTLNHEVLQIINQGERINPELGLPENFYSASEFIKKDGLLFLKNTHIVSAYEELSLNGIDIHQIVTTSHIDFNSFTINNLSPDEIKNRYQCDVSVDNRFGTNSLAFYGKKPSCDKLAKYSPAFWATTSFNKIDSSIRAAIEKLSGRPLEEQFANNTELLISERMIQLGFKSFQGHAKTIFKKRLKEVKRDKFINDCN